MPFPICEHRRVFGPKAKHDPYKFISAFHKQQLQRTGYFYLWISDHLIERMKPSHLRSCTAQPRSNGCWRLSQPPWIFSKLFIDEQSSVFPAKGAVPVAPPKNHDNERWHLCPLAIFLLFSTLVPCNTKELIAGWLEDCLFSAAFLSLSPSLIKGVSAGESYRWYQIMSWWILSHFPHYFPVASLDSVATLRMPFREEMLPWVFELPKQWCGLFLNQLWFCWHEIWTKSNCFAAYSFQLFSVIAR